MLRTRRCWWRLGVFRSPTESNRHTKLNWRINNCYRWVGKNPFQALITWQNFNRTVCTSSLIASFPLIFYRPFQWMVPILLVMLIYLGTWTISAPPYAEKVSHVHRTLVASASLHVTWQHVPVEGDEAGVKLCSVELNKSKLIWLSQLLLSHLFAIPSVIPDTTTDYNALPSRLVAVCFTSIPWWSDYGRLSISHWYLTYVIRCWYWKVIVLHEWAMVIHRAYSLYLKSLVYNVEVKTSYRMELMALSRSVK